MLKLWSVKLSFDCYRYFISLKHKLENVGKLWWATWMQHAAHRPRVGQHWSNRTFVLLNLPSIYVKKIFHQSKFYSRKQCLSLIQLSNVLNCIQFILLSVVDWIWVWVLVSIVAAIMITGVLIWFVYRKKLKYVKVKIVLITIICSCAKPVEFSLQFFWESCLFNSSLLHLLDLCSALSGVVGREHRGSSYPHFFHVLYVFDFHVLYLFYIQQC